MLITDGAHDTFEDVFDKYNEDRHVGYRERFICNETSLLTHDERCCAGTDLTNLKVLYRIGRANKKVADGVHVLCDQQYIQEIRNR